MLVEYLDGYSTRPVRGLTGRHEGQGVSEHEDRPPLKFRDEEEAGVHQFLVQDPDGYLARFQPSLGRRATAR